MPFAANELRKLQRELIAHLLEYGPKETFVSNNLLRKLTAALRNYNSGKARSLDHAFGLVRARHRPRKSRGDRFELACDAYEIMYRAGRDPKPTWAQIAGELDADEKYGVKARDLRKMVEDTYADRVRQHFLKIDARIISRRVAQRHAANPRPKPRLQ